MVLQALAENHRRLHGTLVAIGQVMQVTLSTWHIDFNAT